MGLAWPLALLTLLAVPALGGFHWWQLRRRRRTTIRFSDVALLRQAAGRSSRWRRHLPVGLLLGALAVLGVASARPQAHLSVPLSRTTIMLALDVSGSMCATDVEPNRLTVAQLAARAFVEDQPEGTRIGIVAFSNSAQTLVPPTLEREPLVETIDALTTARGTAIGAAILQSIDAIAEINPDVAPVDARLDASGADVSGLAPDAAVADTATSGTPAGPSAGSPDGVGYIPDIIVLLTDGSNTRGIEPLDAVPFAVERGVRVYTIGFGTTTPAGMSCTVAQLGSRALDQGFDPGGFGGGGGGGGGFGGNRGFLLIDEPTLQAVAERTGGTYHRAEDAGQLQEVFDELPQQVELQTEDREITGWFALAGAVVAAAAVALSLRWNVI